MPKCDLTGVWQMVVMKCLHPKYENKYAGYKTCREGLRKGSDGQAVRKGPCPYFIPGATATDNWCRLREEYNNERNNRENKKRSGKR